MLEIVGYANTQTATLITTPTTTVTPTPTTTVPSQTIGVKDKSGNNYKFVVIKGGELSLE